MIETPSQEFEEWQLKYEAEQMVYADTNGKIADFTVALLLGQYPRLLWAVMRLLIFAMLDDRLRETFGYPEQSQWLRMLVKASLKHVHGTCVALFLPPRPLSWGVNRIFVDVNEDGARFDVNKPRKLAFNRYGSSYPDGYKLSEVGRGKPGALGCIFLGELLCPISERYFQTPWPPRSWSLCIRQQATEHVKAISYT